MTHTPNTHHLVWKIKQQEQQMLTFWKGRRRKSSVWKHPCHLQRTLGPHYNLCKERTFLQLLPGPYPRVTGKQIPNNTSGGGGGETNWTLDPILNGNSSIRRFCAKFGLHIFLLSKVIGFNTLLSLSVKRNPLVHLSDLFTCITPMTLLRNVHIFNVNPNLFMERGGGRGETYLKCYHVCLTFLNEYMLCGQRLCFTSFHIAFWKKCFLYNLHVFT